MESSVLTSGRWTQGVLIGLPALIICAIAATLFGLFLARCGRKDEDGMLVGFGIAIIIVVAVVVTICGWGYWPYKAEYHQYRPVAGTVETISNRFMSVDGGGSDQKFVVTLKEYPNQPFSINDTRAALLHRGSKVKLFCIRIYEYGSNNAGRDCLWGQ